MSINSPALQWYPNDWLGSRAVRMMDAEQRGWYIQLLMESWVSHPQGYLPNDTEFLQCLAGAKPTGVEQSFNTRWAFVQGQFEADGETLYNCRVIEELNKQTARRAKASEAGKRSAAARKGKPQRRPRKAVAKPFNDRSTNVELPLNQVPTKSQLNINSSSSSSSIIKEEEKREEIPPIGMHNRDDFSKILDHWETVTGQKVRRDIAGNRRPVEFLLIQGHGADDIMAVMDHKLAEWDTPKMRSARRIGAILKPDNFDGYLQIAREWRDHPDRFSGADYEELPAGERMKIIEERQKAGTMRVKKYDR